MIPDLIFALTAVNSYLTGPACLWETTWPLDGILTTVTWKEMKRNSELIPYNSKEPNNKKKTWIVPMETCIETPNVSNKLNVPENLIKILGTLFFFFSYHINSINKEYFFRVATDTVLKLVHILSLLH